MEEIVKLTDVPLVFMVEQEFQRKIFKKLFLLGTAKINVNTENQIASAKAVREVLAANPEVYDPRKY